jgi:hypothetical protein
MRGSADVVVIEELLSPAECGALIARAEAAGFRPNVVETAYGPVFDAGIRNHHLALCDDPSAARELFSRLAGRIAPTDDGRPATGLNERFRVQRYDPGQRIAGHRDANYRRAATGEASERTLLVYLNDGFPGGQTRFLEGPGAPRTITPGAGTAVVFPHWLLHEALPLVAGRKYVLRTDVMFAAPAAR